MVVFFCGLAILRANRGHPMRLSNLLGRLPGSHGGATALVPPAERRQTAPMDAFHNDRLRPDGQCMPFEPRVERNRPRYWSQPKICTADTFEFWPNSRAKKHGPVCLMLVERRQDCGRRGWLACNRHDSRNSKKISAAKERKERKELKEKNL